MRTLTWPALDEDRDIVTHFVTLSRDLFPVNLVSH